MNLPCAVWRPSDGPPAWGETEAPAILVWSGACRLQQHSTGDGTRVTADQAVQVRDYLAVLPYEVLALVRAGEAGDVLKAAGRTYQILDALQGSELWECDLILQATDGS